MTTPTLEEIERAINGPVIHHFAVGSGVTACGLGPSPERPRWGDWWPTGDLWVLDGSSSHVTCPRCLAKRPK